MSDPVISFQNSGFSAQTLATATIVSIPDAPPELAALPAGMVVPSIIIPPEDPSASLPVLQMILPDGKQMDIPVKISRIPPVPTSVSLKIMPFSPKKGMTVQVHFSAPLPDVNKAIQDMPEALRTENTVSSALHRQGIPVRAFVLHSVPEQISAIMNELESSAGENPTPLKPDQSIRLKLSPLPEQAPSPLTERTDSPVSQTAGTNDSSVLKAEGNVPPPLTSSEPSLPEEASAFIPHTPVEGEAPVSVLPDPLSGTLPPQQTENAPSPVSPAENGMKAPASVIPEKNFSGTPADAHPIAAPAVPSFSTEHTPQQTTVPAMENTAVPKETSATKQTPFVARPAELPSGTVTEPPPVRIPLNGVVFDFKERSAPLVITKIGVLALEEKIQLPHLTPVLVEITDIAEPPILTVPEHETDAPFKSVEEALNLFQKTDPEAFEAFKSVLPQTGTKLPALIHTFVHAASQNAFTAFIGENNIAALQNLGEKGRSLLQEIEKEFSSSSKKVSDGRNSWKGWNIPVLSGAIVEPVSLYLQRPDENAHRRNEKNAKPDAVRFVLDLNLTRLGKLQMDGLAHRFERRFDLIVRHQNDLPDFFDDKIRSIFTQTLSALNYTGTVKVDHTDQFIVLEEPVENRPERGVWA